MKASGSPALAAGLLVVCCLGCNRYDGPPLHPVNGTVTLDGKPLANAGVMFLPRETTRGNACLGITDASGKYVLKPERGGGEGCQEGTFAVTISKMKDPPPAAGEVAAAETGTEETLPARYWDSAHTVLSAKVPAGGASIDFQLDSKP
jgi:hypothetical protein